MAEKVGEFAKRSFNTIRNFAFGAFVGAAAVTCHAIFSAQPASGYVLDLKLLGITALVAGIVVGVSCARNGKI